MAARKKSGKSRSSADSSNVLQLLFQIVVIVAIGWFIYSGYTEKHSVPKAQKPKSTQTQVQKNKPVKPQIVLETKSAVSFKPIHETVVSKSDELESDQVIQQQIDGARSKGKALKADVARERSNHNVYPEIAMASPRPKKISKPSRKPKIIFIIDDIGHTNEFQSLVFALGSNITYSILPDLKYSLYFDKISLKTGADVILHLPLETQSGRYPGPGLIEGRMSDEEVLKMLRHNFESTPHSIGGNSHMGSLGSTDRHLIRVILGEFKRRGKFFLDSYTTKDSVIMDVGQEMGMKVHRRDIFLDNTDEQGYIRKQIKQLADVSYKNGFAVGIGHYRYNTLKVIIEEIPRLKDSGYEIIPLSQIYQ